MFCPNCGTNCGEANFCHNCGTKLIVDTPQLLTADEDSYAIPVGEYTGAGASVWLGEDEFVIRNKIFAKIYEESIPYDKVTELLFARPYGLFGPGYIVVRWEGNAHIPLPSNKSEMSLDKTSISFANEPVFYQIFQLLRSQAPSCVKSVIVDDSTEKTNLDAVLPDLDLNAHFDQFNPYRRKASAALRQKYRINRKTAWQLITKLFDARQMELYDADPSLAIRDLNRVIKEEKRFADELRNIK